MLQWERQPTENPSTRLPGYAYCARTFRVVWWLGSPLALLGACWLGELRLNLTGSMPIGLYITTHEPTGRGTIVLACLPLEVAELAKRRGYLPRGGSCPGGVVPVGKPVLAIPGDTVTVSAAGLLLLNGAHVPSSASLPADRNGRPLPRLKEGRYVVGVGELWLVSQYSRFSFDSRYFGAVRAGQIRAHVRLIWAATPYR